MKIEEIIKGQMVALLERYPEGDFERKHFSHVLEYSDLLAKKRGLNPTVAKLTAMLHDVGRIKNGTSGKQHARDGKKLARKWLSEVGYKQVETVATAIKNHRHKARIEDSYSELIKDADSLAHEREFPEIPWEEEIRCQVATADGITCSELPIDIGETLKTLTDKINLHLEKNELSVKAVHQLRIDLRMAETLLWWIDYENYQELQVFYSQLKMVFKRYEKIRAYHVYKKHLVNMDQMALEEVMERMIDEALRELGPLSRLMMNLPEKQIECMPRENTVDLMKKYQKKLAQIDSGHIRSLHQFRIFNKRVMYLSRLGAIDLSPVLLDSVNTLHDVLGDLNDLTGLTQLIKKHVAFKVSDVQSLKLALALIGHAYDLKLHETKKELFKVRLLLRGGKE